MNLVLSGTLNEGLIRSVTEATRPTEVKRLSRRALRLINTKTDPDARNSTRHACETARIDHAFIENGARLSTFKLMALDMDSTLIDVECIDEIAALVGKGDEVSAVTIAAMQGKIADFSASLIHRVSLLSGVDSEILKDVYESRVNLSTGALELIQSAKKAGCFLLLLSGGFTYFTERLKRDLGLNAAYSNELEIKNNKLTGKLIGPILDGEGKKQLLEQYMYKLNCNSTNTIAIGDGANDIPMLRCSDYSVSYRGKPAVAEIASLSIVYGGLDVLLDYFSEL